MFIKSTYGAEDRVDMGMVSNIWGGDYEHPLGVVNQGLLFSEYVDSTTNIPMWWAYAIRDPYGLATYEMHLRGLIIIWGDSDALLKAVPRPQIILDTYNWAGF